MNHRIKDIKDMFLLLRRCRTGLPVINQKLFMVSEDKKRGTLEVLATDTDTLQGNLDENGIFTLRLPTGIRVYDFKEVAFFTVESEAQEFAKSKAGAPLDKLLSEAGFDLDNITTPMQA